MSASEADFWGEPAYAYTRRQAIEDGVLVDLMQHELMRIVEENGFKYPIAMTLGAFVATISDPDSAGPLPDGQDINGRTHDVLWMLRCAIRAERRFRQPCEHVEFQVSVWDGNKHNVVRLWSKCHGGDNGEPVITIMLEGED